MILILTEGPRADGEELVRSTGQPGSPSQRSGRGRRQLGNRQAATEQRLRSRGRQRATARATDKTGSPAGAHAPTGDDIGRDEG